MGEQSLHVEAPPGLFFRVDEGKYGFGYTVKLMKRTQVRGWFGKVRVVEEQVDSRDADPLDRFRYRSILGDTDDSQIAYCMRKLVETYEHAQEREANHKRLCGDYPPKRLQ